MAMTLARKKEIELNNLERIQRAGELEDMYQSMAQLIQREEYRFHVYDDRYPKLIVKNDINKKKYEIVIKEVE